MSKPKPGEWWVMRNGGVVYVERQDVIHGFSRLVCVNRRGFEQWHFVSGLNVDSREKDLVKKSPRCDFARVPEESIDGQESV